MDQNEKKAQIAGMLIGRGIVSQADQEKEIATLAAAVTDAVASANGLTTDVDKAYFTLTSEAAAPASVAPTAVAPVGQTAPSATTSAEKMHYQAVINKNRDSRNAVSAGSSIQKLIFDRPAPADVIPTGATFVIDENGKKTLEKYKDAVKEDDAEDVKGTRVLSRTNYNELVKAAENGTPIAVHIGKMNERPIGVIVKCGSSTDASAEEKIMDTDEFKAFLTLNTAGYILADPTHAGAKLRFVQSRAGKGNQAGKKTDEKVVVSWHNKKSAVESKSFDISQEKSAEMVDITVRSELCFRVVDKEHVDSKGAYKTKTIRVSGKISAPKLQRKTQYIDALGSADKSSNKDLMAVPDAKARTDINTAMVAAIALLKNASNSGDQKVLDMCGNALEAYDMPASAAQSLQPTL